MASNLRSPYVVASSARGERLEARLTASQKELLQQAAELEGRSLTDFVIDSAQTAARHVIRDHQLLELTARDSEVFVNALLNPPAPNAKLRRAFRRADKLS
jgi:uncharacterized protein (DUF1778 family)